MLHFKLQSFCNIRVLYLVTKSVRSGVFCDILEYGLEERALAVNHNPTLKCHSIGAVILRPIFKRVFSVLKSLLMCQCLR